MAIILRDSEIVIGQLPVSRYIVDWKSHRFESTNTNYTHYTIPAVWAAPQKVQESLRNNTMMK